MRKQTTKALLVCALISILIIPQLGCGSNLNNPFASNNTYEGIGKTGFYLDTVCKITVYSMKDEDGHLASLSEEELKKEVDILITEAFKLCTQYENLFSKTIDTSEIAKINTAKGKPVEVSEETVAVIDKGIEYGNLSEGAFDITIGKATDLWNFREADEVTHEGGDIPSEKTLKEAVSHVNYKKIKIKDNSVTLEDPEMEIDLGGIAKGYIADRVADFLQGKGVTSAVISLGGNIEVIGGKPKDFFDEERGDFSIGITDPLSETGQLLAVIPCKDKTVVTSGTYERFFEKDGVKYHHILDVKTGYPVDTDVLSVTIIADKGRSVDCDGLSTTCLTLGMEKGMELIKDIEGVEAVFVDNEGNITTSDKALEADLC